MPNPFLPPARRLAREAASILFDIAGAALFAAGVVVVALVLRGA